MSAELREIHPPRTADEVDDNLFQAVKSEVKHEVRKIEENKQPVDPTHSDVLVQKHFSGLAIILLILVALFLVAAIAGIAIYSHH
jgi:hypothetical protein